MTDGQNDHEDADPGLARERTSLAWTRTALSFAAVGGVLLKKDVVAGLIVLATAPVIWELGRLAHHRPGRLRLVTATIVAPRPPTRESRGNLDSEEEHRCAHRTAQVLAFAKGPVRPDQGGLLLVP